MRAGIADGQVYWCSRCGQGQFAALVEHVTEDGQGVEPNEALTLSEEQTGQANACSVVRGIAASCVIAKSAPE